MLNALRGRLAKNEEGFTLIELMVVVLIIAILIAIAIPTFLGAQDRARDRGAQSNLRNALTAAKTLATDRSGLFQQSDGTAIDAAAMELVEPSLTYSDAAAAVDTVLVVVEDTGTTVGTSVTFVTESASEEAFCISSNQDGEVTYGRNADPTAIDDAASCTGGW